VKALVAVPDLLFQSRIEPVLRAQGMEVDEAVSFDIAQSAVRHADLLIVDLQAEGFDAPALVRSAKGAGVRVLAFGRHTDAPALRAAREAGADLVVARSQLAEEMPELLDRLLGASSRRGGRAVEGGTSEN
jgi:DNA-binding response OmpR family regulator